MKKVTYLLGAGASANCLPVVNNMATQIDIVRHRVIDILKNIEFNVAESERTKVFDKDLNELQQLCDKNYSVDTYAKKLFIRGDWEAYLRLKDQLSLFFTLQQKVKSVDGRYDNFWAALLTSGFNLPDNIRIVSWNYDSQVEISYKDFYKTTDINQAYSKLNTWGPFTNSRWFDPNKFGFIKLNGSAKFKMDHPLEEEFMYLTRDFHNESLGKSFFLELADKYEELRLFDKTDKKRFYTHELSFAWEGHKRVKDFEEKIKESLKNTSVLVVIGYSFPIYNRSMDKKIVNEFMPGLSKVYLQAPDAEQIRDRFLALSDSLSTKHVVLNKDTGQFVFPNELDI